MKNDYEIRGDVTAIFIKSKGRVIETIIDTDDMQLVMSSPNRWFTSEGYVYRNRSVKYVFKHRYLHRLIVDAPDNLIVDHIDHNPLNNCKSNLRVVSYEINNQNHCGANKNSKSGARGVVWDKKNNLWMVSLRVKNKTLFIGRYDTLEEAEREAQIARKVFYEGSNEDIEVGEGWSRKSKRIEKPNKQNRSGFRNVSWCNNHKKWRVHFQRNNIFRCVGEFDDLNEAVKYAEEIRKKLRSNEFQL